MLPPIGLEYKFDRSPVLTYGTFKFNNRNNRKTIKKTEHYVRSPVVLHMWCVFRLTIFRMSKMLFTCRLTRFLLSYFWHYVITGAI